MAHESLAVMLLILGLVLIISFYLGPSHESRKVKRFEAQIILIPTGVILLIMAAIVFSGVLG